MSMQTSKELKNSIPIIQYIVVLRKMFISTSQIYVSVEAQKVAMFWFGVHDTHHWNSGKMKNPKNLIFKT